MQHFTQKKFHVDCETKAGNAVPDRPKRKISSTSQKHADNCRSIDMCSGHAWRFRRSPALRGTADRHEEQRRVEVRVAMKRGAPHVLRLALLLSFQRSKLLWVSPFFGADPNRHQHRRPSQIFDRVGIGPNSPVTFVHSAKYFFSFVAHMTRRSLFPQTSRSAANLWPLQLILDSP